MEDETSEEAFYMTDAEIDAKHIRLRGSLAPKYPPREACCQKRCGAGDNNSDRDGQHQCFLVPGHADAHEFSSECGRLQPKAEFLGRLDLRGASGVR